jgi:hypothetical protein
MLVLPPGQTANPTSCTIRIEMREGTTWDEYEMLHREMERIGFLKEIVGDSGQRYALPDAVYYGTSYVPIETLRDWVRQTANAISPGAGVLVMETPSAAWYLPIAS